ncbi:hypothetical protein [Flavobacterium yafengii]|uniref:hypothetical protein n=1 Tax=Flavobacterium yafengii TaxID=3041253 RepID=UPI0031F626BD
MEHKKDKNIFVDGAIPASFISHSIAKHAAKTVIGGDSIFLGQVRADEINGKNVAAIDCFWYFIIQ